MKKMVVNLIPFNTTSFEQRMATREWRNTPDVACWFKIPFIDEETHRRWVLSMEESHARSCAFFIRADGTDIGVTYFHSINYQEGTADWGIYLRSDSARGKGLGSQAMQQAIDYAINTLHLCCLMLDVHRENTRAIRLYERMGFRRLHDEENGFLRYIKELPVN